MWVKRESGLGCEHYTKCSYEEQNCNIENVAEEINMPLEDVEEMLSMGAVTTYYDRHGDYTHFQWVV